jgi:hypothetical protein
MKTNKQSAHRKIPAKWTVFALAGIVVASQTACKSRFFFFGQEPQADATSGTSVSDTRSGQIAIGQQNNDNAQGQPQTSPAVQSTVQAPAYKAVQGGSQKTVQLGKTTQFDVNGQRVDVTFMSILEDSRCPKDVVCIWEGQARLKFTVSIPSANINKVVEATLRAGHPQLGQILVDGIGIDLVGLNPDTATNTAPAQRPSPEATLVVGKAP